MLMKVQIEKKWLDIPHTTAVEVSFKKEDGLVRTKQIISLPSSKKTDFYAKIILLNIVSTMSRQRHVLNLQQIIGDSKPQFDRREYCNVDFQDMLEYTYMYVQHGGDENQAARLFEMFDLMFMQIHEYYHQFDSI